MFFYASTASDTSVTSSSESFEYDNPEPAPECVRRKEEVGVNVSGVKRRWEFED